MILRYFFALILICFLHPSNIKAQSIQWGVSASMSIHELDFDAPLPWWSPSGLIFPAATLHAELPLRFIEGPLGNMLWLSSGIRYVRIASRVDLELELGESNQLFTGEFQTNQHYAAIPVQLRLDLGTLPVYLQGGPEVQILIAANRVSKTFTPEESRATTRTNLASNLKRVNLSIYGGIGVHLGDRVDLVAKIGQGAKGALRGGEQTVSDSDWTNKEIEVGLKIDFRN